jgi:hypothetical protein
MGWERINSWTNFSNCIKINNYFTAEADIIFKQVIADAS